MPGRADVDTVNLQVEDEFHVARGILLETEIACSYVPPDPNVRLAALEVIVPSVPPPAPSFFIVPVTVVRLLLAEYLPPPPTAVKTKVPSMPMVLVPPPANPKAIKPTEPLIVNVLPEPIVLPLSSMLSVLVDTEEVKETAAELEIVKLLIVAGGTAKIIAASISMTTSCLFVGTESRDQFKAEPHKLSPASPSQVLVVCPKASLIRNKLPVSINSKGRNLHRPGVRLLKIGEM